MKLSLEILHNINELNFEVLEFVLNKSTVKSIKELLKSIGVTGYSRMKKSELIDVIYSKLNIVHTEEVVDVEPVKEFTHADMMMKQMEYDYRKHELGDMTFDEFLYGKEVVEVPVNDNTLPIPWYGINQSYHPNEKCYFRGVWDKDLLKQQRSIYINLMHPDKKNKYNFYTVQDYQDMLIEYKIRLHLNGHMIYDLYEGGKYNKSFLDELSNYLNTHFYLRREVATRSIQVDDIMEKGYTNMNFEWQEKYLRENKK